jgi:preprotein translocase subunit SecB
VGGRRVVASTVGKVSSYLDGEIVGRGLLKVDEIDVRRLIAGSEFEVEVEVEVEVEMDGVVVVAVTVTLSGVPAV